MATSLDCGHDVDRRAGAQLKGDLKMEAKAYEVLSRERVHIRARESGNTLSAWRIELAAPGGAIVFAELSPGKAWYRGEGALLGTGQEKLAEIWKACLPETGPDKDYPQLG
jgi:hypothetical protein